MVTCSDWREEFERKILKKENSNQNKQLRSKKKKGIQKKKTTRATERSIIGCWKTNNQDQSLLANLLQIPHHVVRRLVCSESLERTFMGPNFFSFNLLYAIFFPRTANHHSSFETLNGNLFCDTELSCQGN